MNEKLQTQLADIIAAIHRAASAGADFALSQLPDIAQQYVIYGRVSGTLLVLIGFALVLLSVWMLRKAVQIDVTDNGNYDVSMALGVPSPFIACFGIVLVCINFSSTLMVWVAPKVWLLKELATLLK